MTVLREWVLPTAGCVRLEIHAFGSVGATSLHSSALDRLLRLGFQDDVVEVRRASVDAADVLGVTMSTLGSSFPSHAEIERIEEPLRRGAVEGRVRVLEDPGPAVDGAIRNPPPDDDDVDPDAPEDPEA